MHRKWLVFGLGLLALGSLTAMPAVAEDDTLREEVQQLRQKVEALEAERGTLLNEEVDEYLAEAKAVEAAQAGKGDAFSRMEHDIDFLVMYNQLLDHERGARGLVGGSVDWSWVYHVTDSMDFFLELTANSSHASSVTVSNSFGTETFNTTSFFPGGFGFEQGGSAVPGDVISATLAGLDDGLGVDSNNPRTVGGSSINVYQAGLYIWGEKGTTRWHFYLAQLDPRRWFQNNAFTGNEETQFINNTFVDSSAIFWRTGPIATSFAGNEFGALLKLELGAEKKLHVTVAYFNLPGRWLDNGAVFVEGRYAFQISGRDANIALLLSVDGLQDNEFGVAFSFDWWVTDEIGLFVKGGFNSYEAPDIDIDALGHFVDTDLSLGVIFYGPFGNRPDDQLGVAIGVNQLNGDATDLLNNQGGARDSDFIRGDDEDEIIIEVFYRYRIDRQEDKLHLTLGAQLITDPAGSDADAGAAPFVGNGFGGEDSAFFVYLRLHGTF